MRTGKGSKTPRSVGAYGSKRGVPDKQNARRRNREDSGRVRESMDEARAAEEALERRLARESEKPALGETPGARYARERREQEAREAEAAREAAYAAAVEREAKKKAAPPPLYRWESLPGCWAIREARKMLRDGYTIQHVMRASKVGYRWLEDIRLDSDGRARVVQEEREQPPRPYPTVIYE